jgi:uncharacterized protein YbjQ (UPF0145 family)
MPFRRCSALAAALLAGAVATPASARDDQRLYDIDFVLQSSEGRDRFDDTVRFQWSGQPAIEGTQTLSIHTSERKTFLPTRTEKEACDQSFIEALAALRDAARAAGADAVVDIKSLHKNREFRSATQYECRLGYLAAGVTLEGKLAKVSK